MGSFQLYGICGNVFLFQFNLVPQPQVAKFSGLEGDQRVASTIALESSSCPGSWVQFLVFTFPAGTSISRTNPNVVPSPYHSFLFTQVPVIHMHIAVSQPVRTNIRSVCTVVIVLRRDVEY